ncbi:response regulator transcription factor [Streptomyces sp. NBC_00455]|uniref:response regulator transcription factor n=1 Tax=Streptomyces sp. NBC_00455 TaxID=2903654 RepID=UPI002E1ED4FE
MTEPRPRIRVLLADDEALIRAGIRAVLAAAPSIEVVAEAADGHETVELALKHRPDVALLDIRMPRLDGLRAAGELRTAAPDTALIMLTTFSEDEYIARALDSGVSGFLLKSGDPRELIAGVQAVADGAAFLSPEVARRVLTHLGTGRLSRATEARTRLDPLTGREREVVARVGAGLSNAEIGAELHVVEGTVKAHVSSVLARLELRNRVQLAILAYEAGLVTGSG